MKSKQKKYAPSESSSLDIWVRAQTMPHVLLQPPLDLSRQFPRLPGTTALLLASIRTHTILMIYTATVTKVDSLWSLTVDFQCFRLNYHERKWTAVTGSSVGTHPLLGERAAVPNFCQAHHLPSLMLQEGYMWVLSTHLCNWSGTSKQHRPPHAHRARTQDTAHPSTPWPHRATGAGNAAGSRQTVPPELLTLWRSPLLSSRLSTSTWKDQTKTLKTPYPFDTHLLFRVSLSP